jgi:hypothetical protein
MPFNRIRKQGFFVLGLRLTLCYISPSPPGRTHCNEQLSVRLWTRRCHSLQIGAHWLMLSFNVKFGLEPAWYTLQNHSNLLFSNSKLSVSQSSLIMIPLPLCTSNLMDYLLLCTFSNCNCMYLMHKHVNFGWLRSYRRKVFKLA